MITINYKHKKMNKVSLWHGLLLIVILSACSPSKTKIEEHGIEPLSDTSLQFVLRYPEPILTVNTDTTSKNKFGFEGGRVIKLANTYHLFTSEMVDNPVWVKMKLGYWTSTDRIHWKRQATIRESSGDFTGKDERASYWSPLPVWDKESSRWHLFYVAYKSEQSDKTAFRMNFDGRIVRAVSEVAGLEGISGPYKDRDIIMKPDGETAPWEGLQGVDSFFPWKVGDTWYAFHGSANTEVLPVKRWPVGIARAPSLNGPWKRWNEKSPIEFENKFIENPIVSEAPGGGWICVYDSQVENALGWAYSENGIDWKRGTPIVLATSTAMWEKEVRTPLGLVAEGNNKYTIFYSAFEGTPDWDKIFETADMDVTCAIGFIEVELKR